MLQKLTLFAVLLLLSACAGKSRLSFPPLVASSSACKALVENLRTGSEVAVLSGLESLFQTDCHSEVLILGEWVRPLFRDKRYSITAEASEFILSDGSQTTYVLEGYERVYLSLLMAFSAHRLGDHDKVGQLLRRANEDQKARIDNPTSDPNLWILQAVLWENLGEPGLARPFWKKIVLSKNSDKSMKAFAQKQIRFLDRGEKSSWQIWRTRASLPKPRWSNTRLTLQGQVYDLAPDSGFISSCWSREGEAAVVSTESWFEELRGRHSTDRRPLTLAKGLTRGAVGISFAATVGTVGVGLAVVACGAEGSDPHLCKASLEAAFALASFGFAMTESYLEPDLRHWEGLPGAFVLRRQGPGSTEPCSRLLASMPTRLLTPSELPSNTKE